MLASRSEASADRAESTARLSLSRGVPSHVPIYDVNT